MHEIYPYLLTALLYAGVAVNQWRVAKLGGPSQLVRERTVVAFGLFLHAWLLKYDLFTPNGVDFGLTNALSAILWLTVMIYWLASLRHQLHTLQAFVLPPAACLVMLQYVVPEGHMLSYAGEPLFKMHLVIAMTAYSLFTFAALHAMLMALAERSLHNRTPLIRMPDFPPIMAMEHLLFQIISAGFVLLTLTLVSGIFFSEQLFHQVLQFNHKTVFSIASWLIFGGLLLGRQLKGWRGKTAIRWTLTGFVLLFLAYVGSKFVLEVLLHRY